MQTVSSFFSRYGWLVVALTAGLLLRAIGWDTEDEKRRFVLFEPDEIQHVDIALNRYQEISGDSLEHHIIPIFNVRGYGILAGHIAYAWSQIEGKPPSVSSLILLNRQLSTVFAVLLIYVVFLIGRGFGLSWESAGFAALLLAFCDLNCSYSHYGLPAIGYVLGVYLTILGLQRWERKNSNGFWWMTLGAAIAFGFKFDFLPLFIVGVYLIYKVWQEKSNRQQHWMAILFGLPLFLILLGMLTGFSWSFSAMLDSWLILQKENQNVIEQDQHWVENPIVYGAAVVAGIGLLATSLAIIGVKKCWDKRHELPLDLLALLLLVGLEFLVRWSIDTPFVRRANIFMPAVALAAAYGAQQLQLKFWPRAIVVAYTLLLALMGQGNHWFDTRATARDWIKQELPADAKIVATPYTTAAGTRPIGDYKADRDWDYLMLHSSYYSRYWKSMTTPFGVPECCEEVYHCRGEKMCSSLQSILDGSDQGVEQIAQFKTRRFLPERWLYNELFGEYESFLGDVLIYKKLK